jgi:hypothetical protein
MSSVAQAGKLIAGLGDEVAPVSVEGEAGWMLAADVAAPRTDSPVLAAEQRARVYRPQGWLSPVLLVDGRIEGVWRHERKGGRVTVVVEPFGDVAEHVRAGAEAQAQRLAAFLGGELEQLSWA